MKRSSSGKKQELVLKKRLELVRTTIRELTPTQLEQVHGATNQQGDVEGPFCPPLYSA